MTKDNFKFLTAKALQGRKEQLEMVLYADTVYDSLANNIVTEEVFDNFITNLITSLDNEEEIDYV